MSPVGIQSPPQGVSTSMTPARATWTLLAAALALAAWRLIARDAPLSVLLLAAPLLGLAALPHASRSWQVIVVLVAIGAALPLLGSRGLADGRSVVAWWPLLVKAWCAAGLVLILAGLVGRSRQVPLALRLPAWVAITAVGLVLTAVLPKLYRHQLVLRPELWREPLFTGAEHETLRTRDGVGLAVTWLPGRTDAGILVLTHGIGGYPQQFIGLTTRMRALGWSVVHWDLRGHGRSSPAAVTYGVHESADLVEVWDHVRATRAGGRPMVAYGGSMGGATLLLAADRLVGCAGIMAESAFSNLAPLISRNLPRAMALVGSTVARLGLGIDLDAIRPLDALVLRAGPPLLLAASGQDEVVAIEHHAALAAAAPRAETLVHATGGHLDAIYAPGWTEAVDRWLAAAVAYHRVHDGLGAVAPAQ